MASKGEAAIRRLLTEVLGRGDVSVLGELVTDDVVVHSPFGSEEIVGLDAYRSFIAAVVGLLGEARVDIEDVLVDGDRLAVRWRAYLDADSPGILGIHMVRCAEDGRIREAWGTSDMVSITDAAEPGAMEKLAVGL